LELYLLAAFWKANPVFHGTDNGTTDISGMCEQKEYIDYTTSGTASGTISHNRIFKKIKETVSS
jgi:hypothetical protein